MDQEALFVEEANYMSQRPLFDYIMGYIYKDSLKKDYPDSIKELEYIYGKSILSNNRDKSIPFDYIASNIIENGIFPLDTINMSSTDALMQVLLDGNNLWTKENRSKLNRQRRLERKAKRDAEKKAGEVKGMIDDTDEVFQLMQEENSRLSEAQNIVNNATMKNNVSNFTEARNVLEEIKNKELKNDFLDIKASLSGKSIDKIMSGKAVSKSVSQEIHIFASANIEKLFKNAKEISTEEGSKQNLKYAHKLYSPFIYKDNVFLAKITVKEYQDNTSNRLYSIEAIDITKPVVHLASELSDKNPKGNPTQALYSDNVMQLVKDVKKAQEQLKNDTNNTLYQDKNKTARGSISVLDDDTYIINLFEKADLSTLSHELAHFFFLEMNNVVKSGMARESLIEDMGIIRKWLGAEEGATLTVDQHEQFARGFEQYLHEGKTPVKGLARAFSRFKRWMRTIYKRAVQLNVFINDDIRGVFDRMIATEQEIAEAMTINGFSRLRTKDLDGLNLDARTRDYLVDTEK